jgi:predicted ester cyclase
MTEHDNLAVQQKFGSAVNSGQLELLRDVIASDVVDHDPAPDQGAGPEGYIRIFAALRTSFPNLAVSVDQTVTDGDKIAIAYTLTGTQEGGVAPTGRKIRARGVPIARFRDGKMVERRGSSDPLGILQQIGARATSA